jgi:hypothetical protein
MNRKGAMVDLWSTGETEFFEENSFCYFFHSRTVHLDAIESFIYPTDAQLDCSKNVKNYIKIYMRRAATCFGFFTTTIRELLYVLC